MDELDISVLMKRQKELTILLSAGVSDDGKPLTDGERRMLLTELMKIEEALTKFLHNMAEFDKNDAEREKAELERDVKTLDIETKAAIEREKIALEHRALDVKEKEMELQDKQKRSDRRAGLLDTVVKTVGSVIGIIVGAGASIVGVDKILQAEGEDRLVLSKAFQLVGKIFRS